MLTNELFRFKRLETRTKLGSTCAFRWSVLKRLPEDYVSQRHVVIVERDPLTSSNTGQCELEERPGPAPPGSDDGVPRLYFSEDEMNL